MATTQKMSELMKFIGKNQRKAIQQGLMGEEGDYFAKMIVDLADRIDGMPVTYEQDGLGENAIAYLHYFKNGSDWYITEKDVDGGVQQAFGKADLYGDGGELGYISITELLECDVELDLHWTPKPLKEIGKE